jgi:hypothetical protein
VSVLITLYISSSMILGGSRENGDMPSFLKSTLFPMSLIRYLTVRRVSSFLLIILALAMKSTLKGVTIAISM